MKRQIFIRPKHFPRPALFILFIAICAGCSQQVIVIDTAGSPIQGADIGPLTPSMNGPTTKTDAAGVASVPRSVGVQETKWISIKKAGFDPVQIDVPAKWPLRVTLAPLGTAKLDVQLTTQP